MERVLIVNPFGIGDVLFSTPLAASLKKSCPDSFVGYLCNRRTQPIISCDPNIDIVFVFEKDEFRNFWKTSKALFFKNFISLLRDIKKYNFGILIDLSIGDRYSLVCGMLGIKRRIGFNYKNRGRFLTDRLDIAGFNERHIVEYYADLLGLLGLRLNDATPRFFLTDDDARQADNMLKTHNINDNDLLIAVIPSSGRSWGKDWHIKCWDYAGYACLCDMLAQRYNAKIMLLGDERDAVVCDKMIGLMRHKALNFSGKTGIRQFAALLSKSGLVISNDGGPLHIASAVGAKTLSIFGPVDERVYGPYPPGPEHIVIKKDIPCRPCYRNFKMPPCSNDLECIKSITPDEVFQAAEQLLTIDR